MKSAFKSRRNDHVSVNIDPKSKSNLEETIIMTERIIVPEQPVGTEVTVEPPVEPKRSCVPFPIFSLENIRVMNYVKREVKLALTMFSIEKDTGYSQNRDRFMNNVIQSLDSFPTLDNKSDITRIFLYYLETIVPCLVTNEMPDGTFMFTATDSDDPNAKISTVIAEIILVNMKPALESGSLTTVELVNRLMN